MNGTAMSAGVSASEEIIVSHIPPGALSRRTLLMGATALAGLPLLSSLARGQDKIDMRIAWWGSDDRHQKTLKIIDLFEAEHPGLTMESQYGGLIGYQDKLSTEFAGGNAPDIMQVSDSRESLIKSGRLLELDDYIKSGELNLSDANTSVLETLKVDGKLYSIPWGLASGCYFIDTKVFADSRVEEPGLDWNWDGFAEKAKAIAAATPDGVYGAADIWAPAGTRSFYPFEFFLRGRGKTAYTPEGKLNFTADELTEWFTFWDELRKAGVVPPAEITALETGFETSPIVTGRAAMYPINSSIASSLQALAPNPLKVLSFPSGVGSTALSGDKYGAFINSSMQVYVNAASEHKDVAIQFLNFVTNSPDAAKIHLMARGVPLSSKIAALVSPDVSPIERSMVDMIQYVQEHAVPEVVSWPVQGGQIQDLMQRSHQEIAFGQSDIAGTVSKFFDEAEFILE
ncbi:MAG: carbohydrate transporter substrate-binding protein [Devosia sp.]|uniref:ABC transporter substrate-binding protein n=1 Tax=Devosia sp. TaxID=1871048 RepID=UPI00261937E2|nr:ABC transporter substrate-binding protein [Devosia sp.]MDB5585742.1 carbohydrate transporter substrate-binding protein [Devosia sp.]